MVEEELEEDWIRTIPPIGRPEEEAMASQPTESTLAQEEEMRKLKRRDATMRSKLKPVTMLALERDTMHPWHPTG